MAESALQLDADGKATVSGVLTFSSAPALLKQGQKLLAQASDKLDMDLTAVTQFDSAGVALLLEWRKLALANNVALTYNNIPKELLAIARISDVETLLAN